MSALLRNEVRDYAPDGERLLRMVESRIAADDPAAERPFAALMGRAGRSWSHTRAAGDRFREYRPVVGSTPALVGVVGAVVGVVIIAAVAVGSPRASDGRQVYAVGATSTRPGSIVPSSRPSTVLGAAVSTAKPSPTTAGVAGTGGRADSSRAIGELGSTVAATAGGGDAPIALPPTGARDWAVFVTDSPRTAVRAAKPTGHLGVATVTGTATVLTSGGPRFSWVGGAPVGTGTDDGRRLAVPLAGGRIRLAGTVGHHGDIVVVYAGTVNGSARLVVRAGASVTQRPIRGGAGAVNVTITVRLPATAAGSTYTIDLVGGTAAAAGGASSAERAGRSSMRADRWPGAHPGSSGGASQAARAGGSGAASGTDSGGSSGGFAAAPSGSGTGANLREPASGLLTLSGATLL
ncbi:MAG: hypothetical protein ACQSGP_03260 [Frankia sp.]